MNSPFFFRNTLRTRVRLNVDNETPNALTHWLNIFDILFRGTNIRITRCVRHILFHLVTRISTKDTTEVKEDPPVMKTNKVHATRYLFKVFLETDFQ